MKTWEDGLISKHQKFHSWLRAVEARNEDAAFGGLSLMLGLKYIRLFCRDTLIALR